MKINSRLFLFYGIIIVGDSMRKKNGFTLVELLAVIVLIALLLVIAVPNALKMSSRVKEKAYDTKVDLIEQAAKNYGQSNIGFVRMGTDPDNTNNHYTCTFTYDDNKDITSVKYTLKSGGYSDSLTLGENEFWCIRLTVDDLVASNDLEWDETNRCDGQCTSSNEQYYDNVVLNPKSNYIINKCHVYVYYRYNRVYAAYDKNTCSSQSNSVVDGHEYKPL